MANFRKHVVGASVTFGIYYAGLAVLYTSSYANIELSEFETILASTGILVCCLSFGILPDIDISSTSQKIFYGCVIFGMTALIAMKNYQTAAILGLISLLPLVSKHRGWTHAKWAIILVPLPLLVLPAIVYPTYALIGLPFYLAGVLGYSSHLLLDGLLFKQRRP